MLSILKISFSEEEKTIYKEQWLYVYKYICNTLSVDIYICIHLFYFYT